MAKKTTEAVTKDKTVSTGGVTRLSVQIEGTAPMIQHNGAMSDPLSEWATKLSRITKKKGKTEHDHGEIAAIETEAGMYLDADGDICVPDSWIEGMLRDAAKKRRLGRSFTAAVLAGAPTYKLDYEGRKKGRPAAELARDPKFRDRRRVVIQGKAVHRCRPIFRHWKLSFDLTLLPGAGVTEDDVKEALDIGGTQIGLSEYRPKFGRFEVTSFEAA